MDCKPLHMRRPIQESGSTAFAAVLYGTSCGEHFRYIGSFSGANILFSQPCKPHIRVSISIDSETADAYVIVFPFDNLLTKKLVLKIFYLSITNTTVRPYPAA